MRSSVFRFFSIPGVSLCLLIMDGCGGGGSDINLNQGLEFPSTQQVIGAQGGVVEVTDPTSSLRGVKVEIPPGALTQDTTITIQDKWFAWVLPTGLTSEYPIVEISPEVTLSTDIQISFPVQSIPPGDDGKILSAFYWDSAKDEWIVIPPRRVRDSTMTVRTNKLGVFRWGIVSLTEVETETVTAWMENMFKAWAELQKTMIDRLVDPWISVIEDPLNLQYCAIQDSIISQLSTIRDVARQRVADYITANNVLDKCEICTYDFPIFDETPDCVPSVCDPNELINGQPALWAIKEYEIFVNRILVEGFAAVLPVIPGELVGVYVAEGQYLQAARELKCDWRCLLLNGDIEFYVDLLLGNASQISIFAILVYRDHEGCIN